MAWLEHTAAARFWPLCTSVPGGRLHRRPHIDCGFCRWGASEGLHHWYLWDQKSMLTYWIYPPWFMMFSWTRPSIFVSGTFKKKKKERKISWGKHPSNMASKEVKGVWVEGRREPHADCVKREFFLSAQFTSSPPCVRNSYEIAWIDSLSIQIGSSNCSPSSEAIQTFTCRWAILAGPSRQPPTPAVFRARWDGTWTTVLWSVWFTNISSILGQRAELKAFLHSRPLS